MKLKKIAVLAVMMMVGTVLSLDVCAVESHGSHKKKDPLKSLIQNYPIKDLQVGQVAPDFSLEGHDGKTYALTDYKGKYLVLEWFNHRCPCIKKHYVNNHMQSLQEKFSKKGVAWLMVNSDVEGTAHNLNAAKAKEVFDEYKVKAKAILLDKDGSMGVNYGADLTQYMVVIDPQGKVSYRGAIDDQPDKNVFDLKTMRNFLTETLDNLMNGRPLAITKTKSYGCPIKYRKPTANKTM